MNLLLSTLAETGDPDALIDSTTELKLGDITIGDRHRKDLGDIKALAESIKKVGLLQPIVIRGDRQFREGWMSHGNEI